MPKYDFKCVSCSKVSEASFPIADGPAPAIVCECGSEAFRVFEPVPAQFKGSGWGSKP